MDTPTKKRFAWNKGLRTGYAPWRGKKRGPHSPETKAKMRTAALGRPKSAEHAANIAKARRGATHSTATKEKIRRTKLAQNRRMSPEEKARLSARWTGRGNPAWGTHKLHGPRTHWVTYGGIKLRSSYELRVARAFDKHGIKWQYEPTRFDLGVCTFLPDFYLPEENAYWEVKGWFNEQSKRRVQLFREQHPELPLVVATDHVITMLEGTRGPWAP